MLPAIRDETPDKGEEGRDGFSGLAGAGETSEAIWGVAVIFVWLRAVGN